MTHLNTRRLATLALIAFSAAVGADTLPAGHAGTALTTAPDQAPDLVDPEISSLCDRIGKKLSSVSTGECMGLSLIGSDGYSTKGTVIAYRDFRPEAREPLARVLLVGGIHGDEYSSVSVVFKWLAMLDKADTPTDFHWRIVPLLNPDGLLMPPNMSQRMNANGVDLNRNFPTPDWDTEAWNYWVNRTRKNKRRYPGTAALSEPESAWLAAQIESFRPDAVISVHAPHGIVDFDGPRIPPNNLGPLELRLLGTYPGSMGRYIGVHKGIPIVTVELESAGRMPRRADIRDIWQDTLGWINSKLVSSERVANQEASDSGEPLTGDNDG